MNIGRGWKENRYRRLEGYLFRRFERVRLAPKQMYDPVVNTAYDRYVRLVTALNKRQKEETC